MPFSAALSTNADTQKAIDEVCTTALNALSGPAPPREEPLRLSDATGTQLRDDVR
jgi:hypothetical protein